MHVYMYFYMYCVFLLLYVDIENTDRNAYKHVFLAIICQCIIACGVDLGRGG